MDKRRIKRSMQWDFPIVKEALKIDVSSQSIDIDFSRRYIKRSRSNIYLPFEYKNCIVTVIFWSM